MYFSSTQISLERLLANLPGFAYRCLNDPTWPLEFISGGVLALTGHRPEDLRIGGTVTYADVIHPQDRDHVWKSVAEALRESRPFQMTYRIVTKQGEEKWVWEQGVGVHDGEGELEAIEGFITDITAAKVAELKAKAATDAQRLIIATQKEIASSDLTRQALLDLLADRAQQLTNARGATIDLFDGKDLVNVANAGTVHMSLGLRLDPDRSLTGLAIKTGTVLYSSDTEQDERVDRAASREAGIRSLLTAPFQSGENICGAIKVVSDQPHAFAEHDIAHLQILVESLGTVIQRYEALERLATSEEQYRLLFDHNPHPMWVYDLETFRFLAVNQSAIAHYGYSGEEFLSMRVRDIHPKEEGLNPEDWLRPSNEKGIPFRIWQHLKKSGVPIQVEIQSNRIDFNGRPACLVLANDVTDRIQAAHDLERASRENLRLALYDPLTKLPNRLLLMDRLGQALSVNKRTAGCGALIFIDLDNFKYLNDAFGHNVGDLFLQECARRISDCLRVSDTVARLGGDEFVVLLERLSSNISEATAQAKALGEKVLAAFAEPCRLAEHEHYTTASIGVALFDESSDNVNTLLKEADMAMYQAKAAGRNAIRIFDPGMQAVVSARSALEADLRLALQENEFELFYQPQVNQHGEVIGAEALLRWQHPLRGMVAPLEFIPVAEDTGLIVPIGGWTLKAACKQLAAWAAKRETAHLSLSVNVSAKQFRHSSFVGHLLDVLEAAGIAPGRLELELTESVLIDDMEMTIAKMTQLKQRGIRFSLDDFGTGYSSLYYLKGLPLDQLKIDQSFVRDIMNDQNDATIVKTIIALGGSLGLDVIAEGVETAAQRDFLMQHGCRLFQGFFFGRPVPLDAFPY
jgi:diguanylate cyclase (GGDEF)-like protein/PAS domain S-box-containing protein